MYLKTALCGRLRQQSTFSQLRICDPKRVAWTTLHPRRTPSSPCFLLQLPEITQGRRQSCTQAKLLRCLHLESGGTEQSGNTDLHTAECTPQRLSHSRLVRAWSHPRQSRYMVHQLRLCHRYIRHLLPRRQAKLDLASAQNLLLPDLLTWLCVITLENNATLETRGQMSIAHRQPR